MCIVLDENLAISKQTESIYTSHTYQSYHITIVEEGSSGKAGNTAATVFTARLEIVASSKTLTRCRKTLVKGTNLNLEEYG